MIKFFRKIRQQLLGEGKTAKYFKYALGEILLVMIGILLALQVNNWNESQKASKTEKEYLIKLHQDIARLEKLYKFIFDDTPEDIQNAHLALDYIESDGKKEDLKEAFIKTLISHQTVSTYPVFKTTYDEMVNLGIVARLDNDKLKNKLTNLFYLIENGNNTIVYFRDEVGRASQSINSKVIFSYDDNEELVVRYNLKDLYDNKLFINALVEIIDVRQDSYTTVKFIYSLTTEVRLLLETELNLIHEEND